MGPKTIRRRFSKETLIDLSAQPRDEIALLRYSPAAGSIGTCRYKLKPNQAEDFDRVIEVFKAHNVGYFIYIGGNDSMDTANKIAQLAQSRGLDLVGSVAPKPSITMCGRQRIQVD